MIGEDKFMDNRPKEILPIVIIFIVTIITCSLDYLVQNKKITAIEQEVLRVQECVNKDSCGSLATNNELNMLYQKLLNQPKRWVATRHSKLLETIGSTNQKLINMQTRSIRNNPLETNVLIPPDPISLVKPQPPPEPIKPSPPSIIKRSEGVIRGNCTYQVKPTYPSIARVAKVEGEVVIEITIDEEGNVMSAKVVSGHPLLQQAALSAARQWKFKPTLLNRNPVKVSGKLTFRFKL
jgi:TonB family protein